MCRACGACLAWAFGIFGRVITFLLACLLMGLLCTGTTIAVISCVAYSTNYTFAEIISHATNESLFRTRRQPPESMSLDLDEEIMALRARNQIDTATRDLGSRSEPEDSSSGIKQVRMVQILSSPTPKLAGSTYPDTTTWKKHLIENGDLDITTKKENSEHQDDDIRIFRLPTTDIESEPTEQTYFSVLPTKLNTYAYSKTLTLKTYDNKYQFQDFLKLKNVKQGEHSSMPPDIDIFSQDAPKTYMERKSTPTVYSKTSTPTYSATASLTTAHKKLKNIEKQKRKKGTNILKKKSSLSDIFSINEPSKKRAHDEISEWFQMSTQPDIGNIFSIHTPLKKGPEVVVSQFLGEQGWDARKLSRDQ